jgi:hypothetical protein
MANDCALPQNQTQVVVVDVKGTATEIRAKATRQKVGNFGVILGGQMPFGDFLDQLGVIRLRPPVSAT